MGFSTKDSDTEEKKNKSDDEYRRFYCVQDAI